MKAELLTLGGSKYSGEATEVLVTTTNGMMVVLPHHEPLTAIIKPGPVTIHNGAHQKDTFAVFGGLLEVTTDAVRILADVAEHSDELVQSEIEAALAEAEALKAAAGTHHELHHAQTLIDRSHVRLGVLKIRRHRRRSAGREQ